MTTLNEKNNSKKEKILLGKRLEAIMNITSQTFKIADVGTDHGYLAVELINNNKSDIVIGSDLNMKPLENARKTISKFGLEEKIELRISDGLRNYSIGEVDTAIIAGMGGDLIIDILDSSINLTKTLKQLIIQPQRAISKVREWLYDNGFVIVDETVVRDSGKFYEIMKVEYTGEKKIKFSSEELKPYLNHDSHVFEIGLPLSRRSDKSQIGDYLSYLKERIGILDKKINGLSESMDKLYDDGVKRDLDENVELQKVLEEVKNYYENTKTD